jgi:TPR repeat protein
MTAYLFAFGKMHQAKLNYAFGKLPEEFLEQPEINIIDYGCGQALGTMCYADFLREKGYSQKVKTITLIEPSVICLKRAALHASVFFPDAKTKIINKRFDDLTQSDIICDEETPTMHIFSNVLDMLGFDLKRFAELIRSNTKGYNCFVCVSPIIGDSNRDTRTIAFPTLLNADSTMPEFLNKYQLMPDKAWTCLSNCFCIGKPYFDANTEIDRHYELAKEGNAEAQFELAQSYCEILNNKSEAFKWFKMSANSNNSEAQMCLGCCYQKGYGVEIDLNKALEWYLASAKSDNVRAMTSIGICYHYGYGVEKDMIKATDWYRKAANRGYSKAQWRYGIRCENGDGVEKNNNKAFELYKMAAEQGDSDGQCEVGRCYQYGIGVEQNNRSAAKYYLKAAEKGNADAQFRLGLLYVTGCGVIKSGITALFWIRKAASQGLKKASDFLARINKGK